jgi:hypothetical protein
MKYFKNTNTYALAFRKGEGTNGELVEFDCLRVYRDTGNIATTGITQVSDEDYEELKKNKMFLRAVKDGELVEVDEKEVKTDADKVKAKDKEIAELKAKLKKAEGGKAVEELDKAKKESEAKDDEIKSLKQQLEALKNAGTEDAGTEDAGAEDF